MRIGEHIGISSLTRKKVKPKGSAVGDHLLLCNHFPSFENFNVLTKENKKLLLELKESLLIIRDKHIENTWINRKKIISCTFLHLIDILNDVTLIC